MNVVLWIVAGLLALAFLGSGLMKVSQTPAKLATMGMGWAVDFSPAAVKTIGGLELLAAIGLILPALLDIAPVFVPLAALGLVLVMIGAMVVHGRRNEKQALPINVLFLVLAAVVVWGRFGPYAF
ncbi:putative membrane protein YphA (DoxX/SURF4 family) [Hamadaea flava]|uniref:DoxX family protein n=1 Tax=Hamadaea flava TaxID=1742688 RepID=A0ABV8LXK5_9ACTN|nr:DoxX family protein [Hamadaea flava]MCP2329134.1 putative membrane protein YphA (DoxX/SURF4 family) [Hamadaea flava]